jgi:hypothetical protein
MAMSDFFSLHQRFVATELADVAKMNPNALLEYEAEIPKAYLLNLDPLKELLATTLFFFSVIDILKVGT